LDIVCSANSALEMMRRRDVERYNVAEPLQRLALLARLATLRSGQRAAGSGQRAAGSGQRAAGHEIVRYVRAIQIEFSVHLKAAELAKRLDVHTGTFGRWSQRESSGTMESVLLWGRVQAVCAYVGRTGSTLADTSAALEFSAPSNLARQLRKTTRLNFRKLARSMRGLKGDGNDVQSSSRTG
jgi:AraC-like DNA-binding protein